MLVAKVVELQEEMNKVKNLMTKVLLEEIDFDSFIETDPRQWELLSKCYRLMNKSMEYAIEQAEAMDSIQEKLDKLIEQTSKD